MRQSGMNFSHSGFNASNRASAQGQGPPGSLSSQQMGQVGFHFHYPPCIGSQTTVSMVFNNPGNYAVAMDLHGSQVLNSVQQQQNTRRRAAAQRLPSYSGLSGLSGDSGAGRLQAGLAGQYQGAPNAPRSSRIASASSNISTFSDLRGLTDASSLNQTSLASNGTSGSGLVWNGEGFNFLPTSAGNQNLSTIPSSTVPTTTNGSSAFSSGFVPATSNGGSSTFTSACELPYPTYGQGQATLVLNPNQQQQINERTPSPPVNMDVFGRYFDSEGNTH